MLALILSGCRGVVSTVRTPAADIRQHRLWAASVESRMGAVAWAMRQRSVSHPRSSNRTCGFPASGSPTGFTVRHTARGTKVGVRGATRLGAPVLEALEGG